MRTLMIAVAVAAVVFYAGVLGMRRSYNHARAYYYAARETVIAADLAVNEGERALCQADLARAGDAVATKERLRAKGKAWNDSKELMDRSLASDRLTVKHHEFSLEQAEMNVARLRGELDLTRRLRHHHAYAASHPWLSAPPDPNLSP